MKAIVPYSATQNALVGQIADLLAEIYEPAGILIFWSSRITYLDSKRPCDLLRDRDWDALQVLAGRLDGVADGNFS